MTPFYFGRVDRQIFGIYGAPAENRPVQGAVVLCQPLGTEYINAHRAVRQLAVMLSDAGFHTLRFDYYGTGDSGGDSDAITLDDLVGDIGQAIDELCCMSGLARVRLVGLRLGGPLVARAASRFADRVQAVVLWDPVVSGAGHIEEFALDGRPRMHNQTFGFVAQIAEAVDLDRLCFPMNATMAAQIRGIELHALARDLPRSAFAVTTGKSETTNAVRAALTGRSEPPIAVENFPNFPCWNEEWPVMVAAVPVKALTRIVGWMSEV